MHEYDDYPASLKKSTMYSPEKNDDIAKLC